MGPYLSVHELAVGYRMKETNEFSQRMQKIDIYIKTQHCAEKSKKYKDFFSNCLKF